MAAIPFAFAAAWFFGFWGLLAFAIMLYIDGIIATEIVLEHSKNKDPSFVVIDEACGQSLALLPLAAAIHAGETPWVLMVAAFIAFRFFDILKPWPVSFFDKKVEGAHGVMLDDVAAGLMAAVIVAGLGFLI